MSAAYINRGLLMEFRDALLEDATNAHAAEPNLEALLRKGHTEIAMQAINCEYAAKMITAFLDATSPAAVSGQQEKERE